MCLHIIGIYWLKVCLCRLNQLSFLLKFNFISIGLSLPWTSLSDLTELISKKTKLFTGPFSHQLFLFFVHAYALSNSVYKQQLDFPSWTSLVSVTPTAPRVWVATLLLVSQNNIWINTEKKQPKKHSPNTLDTVYLVQLPTQWQTGV